MTVTVHTASLAVWTKSILRRSVFVVITTTEVILRASRHLFRFAKASRQQASSVTLGHFLFSREKSGMRPAADVDLVCALRCVAKHANVRRIILRAARDV